jgi:hypothetical protein
MLVITWLISVTTKDLVVPWKDLQTELLGVQCSALNSAQSAKQNAKVLISLFGFIENIIFNAEPEQALSMIKECPYIIEFLIASLRVDSTDNMFFKHTN